MLQKTGTFLNTHEKATSGKKLILLPFLNLSISSRFLTRRISPKTLLLAKIHINKAAVPGIIMI